MKLIGLGLLLTGICFGEVKRPNIVFIFSDDHATEAISAYGGRFAEVAPTPNIDRLAKEGALIRNSFCCNSICGPSRAAVLTGKHSHVNGYLDNSKSRFNPDQMTFPKLMQKGGYQTAMVGKWHLKSDPQGFDYWEVLPGQGSYYQPDFKFMPEKPGGKVRKRQYEGYVTDIVVDRALDWLESGRDKDKPFVLMCQQKAPHRNWSPPLKYVNLYDGMEIPEPSSLRDDYSGRSVSLKDNEMSIKEHFHWEHDMKFHGDVLFPKYFLSKKKNTDYDRMNEGQRKIWDESYEPKNQRFIAAMKAGEMSDDDILKWKYQRYIKDYLRCIKSLDDSVGRVLDYLDEKGLSENTIVIYSSDQGFYLGEHGWYDKRWMFEESLEMPFLVRWPGVVKPGARPTQMIQNIDYAPTFLEIGGVEVPKEIQGVSLLPVLKGTAGDDWRKAIYYQYTGEAIHNVAKHDGVRTERYKLMYFPETNEWNLFDLLKDPEEMKSVSGDAAYVDVLQSMKKVYKEQRALYLVK